MSYLAFNNIGLMSHINCTTQLRSYCRTTVLSNRSPTKVIYRIEYCNNRLRNIYIFMYIYTHIYVYIYIYIYICSWQTILSIYYRLSWHRPTTRLSHASSVWSCHCSLRNDWHAPPAFRTRFRVTRLRRMELLRQVDLRPVEVGKVCSSTYRHHTRQGRR